MSKKNKIPVVTICGSTKFYDQYQRAIKELTMTGNVVLSCPIFSQSKDKEWWSTFTQEEQEQNIQLLSELHMHRIDLSDAIFVVNPDNYIGKSTKAEIEYARENGKAIMYMYGTNGCVFDS